ncbi:MAG: hypothetical protein Q9182_006875 [Xanthomendoza sp. 2 TL-2023]
MPRKRSKIEQTSEPVGTHLLRGIKENESKERAITPELQKLQNLVDEEVNELYPDLSPEDKMRKWRELYRQKISSLLDDDIAQKSDVPRSMEALEENKHQQGKGEGSPGASKGKSK